MSTTQRRIEITGSDAGFGRMASNLADELGRSFEEANQELERMSGNAADFTEVLEGRLGAIETSVQNAYANMSRRMEQQRAVGNDRLRQMRDEVTQAERVLRVETERARLAERMRYQNRMREINDAGGTNEERRGARAEHTQNMQGIQEDATVRLLQIRGLRGLLGQEQASSNAPGGGRGSEDDREKDDERDRGSGVLSPSTPPFIT